MPLAAETILARSMYVHTWAPFAGQLSADTFQTSYRRDEDSFVFNNTHSSLLTAALRLTPSMPHLLFPSPTCPFHIHLPVKRPAVFISYLQPLFAASHLPQTKIQYSYLGISLLSFIVEIPQIFLY